MSTSLGLEQRSGLGLRAELHVERSDITFGNVSPERVRIEVVVQNLGEERSEPTHAVLSAAPLGAFVPWRPLAVLPVPAIEPGDSLVLHTSAARALPVPLGPPDQVPPRRLLTALGAADDRPGGAPAALRPGTRPTAGLPADLLDLMGRPGTHWAGNLNVFLVGRAVERHLAQALRIYPGRTNLAMFVLGSGRDAYRFHLIGEGQHWGAALFDITDGRSLTIDVKRFPPVEEGEWLEIPHQRMMLLALCPPNDCGCGTVEVHVEQRSSGQSAVVEFSLDPSAAGPGCYVV
jgi:hypothetical protein